MQVNARWIAVLRDGRIIRGIDDNGRVQLFKSVLPHVSKGEVVSVGWEPLPQKTAQVLRQGGTDAVAGAIVPKIVNIPPTAKEVLPYMDVEIIAGLATSPVSGTQSRVVAYCVSVDGLEVLRIPAA